MNPSHVGREQIIENNIAALGSPSMKTLDREQIIALGKFLGFPSLRHLSLLQTHAYRRFSLSLSIIQTSHCSK